MKHRDFSHGVTILPDKTGKATVLTKLLTFGLVCGASSCGCGTLIAFFSKKTMNAAQIHLALNHFPIFATLFGTALLLWGLLLKQEAKRQLALVFLVVAAVSAVPVYLSGEPAEEIIEHRVGVSESSIHDHEDLAEQTFLVIGVLGMLCLFILAFLKIGKNIPMVIWISVLFGAFVVLGLLFRVAHLGGQIRHDELRVEIYRVDS